MVILKLEDRFSSFLATKFNEIIMYQNADIERVLEESAEIKSIQKNMKKILNKNFYVILKNINFHSDKTLFFNFLKLFGNIDPTIEFVEIKIDYSYSGSSNNYLLWHTDDPVMETPPIFTALYVINEDPLKITQNGILDIDDLIYYLELNDKDFLIELLNKKLPMLSKGIHYYDKDKSEYRVQKSILYKDNNNIYVRFDLARIKYYYSQSNITQDISEKKFIHKFLTLIDKLKKKVYLEKNDLLIINNKKTLHDRGECSIELNQDGSFNTREVFIGFIHE